MVDARDLSKLSTRMETSDVNGVKFGETSAHCGGGNPELSLGAVFTPVGRSKCVAVGT